MAQKYLFVFAKLIFGTFCFKPVKHSMRPFAALVAAAVVGLHLLVQPLTAEGRLAATSACGRCGDALLLPGADWRRCLALRVKYLGITKRNRKYMNMY
jgi:hypothetical protein